jgi:hypothetical protein
MLLLRKIWTSLVVLVIAVSLCTPASAGDTLKKFSPKRHPYLYTVIGGTAAGAGVGALFGGRGNFAKGMLIGGGGASAFYLHFHHQAGGDKRPIAYFATHSALGLGVGWTVCGCGVGAGVGLLVGAGADLLWQSMRKQKPQPTATTTP